MPGSKLTFLIDIKTLSKLLGSESIDPRRHWSFKSHSSYFDLSLPLVIREADETRAWINFHKNNPLCSEPISVLVMSGGPLVVKDEITGEWTRRLEISMKAGENHTLILRSDPVWDVPNNSATNFVYHGTLVVEMIAIGDSRGVDLEIERGLISVAHSSIKTISRLGPLPLISSFLLSIISVLYFFLGKRGIDDILNISNAGTGLIGIIFCTWIGFNFVKRNFEIKRRLRSNLDYLELLGR